jgi:hypothetical protein
MQNTFTKCLDAVFWISIIVFISTGFRNSAELRRLTDSQQSSLVEDAGQSQESLRSNIQKMLHNQNQLNEKISRLIEYHPTKTEIENQDRKDMGHPTPASPNNASHDKDIQGETEVISNEERLSSYTDVELKDLKRGIFEQRLERFESSLTDADLEELELRTQMHLKRFLDDALSTGRPLPEGVSLDFLQKDESSLLPKEKFVRDQMIESMRKSALAEMQTEEETRKEFQRIEEMELELDEQEAEGF